MGRELGRISGPLLADNLKRNGVDLAFDNSLLYINPSNSYVGINSFGASSDLTIGQQQNNGGTSSGTLNTVNLIGGTTTNIGNFTISGSTIQHLTGGITVSPNQSSNPTIVTPGLSTTSLYFRSNTLSPTVTNDNLNFTPNGTGQINLANDAGNVLVTVNGSNLHATGNITWDGNIIFGTNANERVTIVAEVNSDIIPVATLNTLESPAQNLISQKSPLFLGVDDETLLFVAPKNTLITPQSLPYTTQDGLSLLTQLGTTLFTNPQAPYIGTSYLYSLGSNTLRWNTVYSNSVTSSTSLVSPSLTSTKLNAGNIGITGTTISNNYPSDNVYLSPTGTGQVTFNGFALITGSNINVPSSTNSLVINSTGTGYVKFADSNGLATPSGSTAKRPVSPQQGQLRFNTDLGYEEVYDASAGGWFPMYGTPNSLATIDDVNADAILYSIIFGR